MIAIYKRRPSIKDCSWIFDTTSSTMLHLAIAVSVQLPEQYKSTKVHEKGDVNSERISTHSVKRNTVGAMHCGISAIPT
jgi:hypothetical protein